MKCYIAELGVEVPEIGDLPTRCAPYRDNGCGADIVIDPAKMKPDRWTHLNEADNYYLQSGTQFYVKLLDYNGMMLHSSCVVVDGYAYLFSGPCGMGKSTHTGIWKKTFADAVIINDDKPALRYIDGVWYAFGTPWCGKDGINENKSAPVAGICFLHRGDREMKRISPIEAVPQILEQTTGRGNAENAAKLMKLIDRLVRDIPLFDFYNHAEAGDALVTHDAMWAAYCEKEKCQ